VRNSGCKFLNLSYISWIGICAVPLKKPNKRMLKLNFIRRACLLISCKFLTRDCHWQITHIFSKKYIIVNISQIFDLEVNSSSFNSWKKKIYFN
jgi:hypothetical protein